MAAPSIDHAPLEPVVRRALTDDVLVTLRKAIVAGAFVAGDHLPESRMAEQLGVSRVPVREAMMALEREGLLAFDARGAARVREFTVEDYEEIFTMRLALEPMAARFACRNLQPADVAALTENIERMRKATRLLDVSLLDVEFHDLVMQTAHHQRLADGWSNLHSQIQLWMARLHKQEGPARKTREDSVAGHREILKALRSGDEDAAENVMRRHLVSWRERVPKSMWEGNVA